MKDIKCKLPFIFALLFMTSQLFGQEEPFGTLKGKTIDENGEALLYVQILIILSTGDTLYTVSKEKALFELKVPIGKHTLDASYLGYQSYPKEIEIQSGETHEYEMKLDSPYAFDWKYSEPYQELSGYWKTQYYTIGNKSVDQSKKGDESGIGFTFSNDTIPGSMGWNDGCNGCGTYRVRHQGNGIIEIQVKGLALGCTLIGCETNQILIDFIAKMKGKQTKSTITNNGEILELRLENEKYIFKKFHDNTYPPINAEIFGTWKPIKGKLKGKEIRNFAQNAEVVFDWGKGDFSERATIIYKDGKECSSDGMNLTYRYLDDDYIGFLYYRSTRKAEICKTKYFLGRLFYALSVYGCTIQHDEAKQTLTLTSDDSLLVLKKD